MKSADTIEVVGPPEHVSRHIFQLAADIQDWPRLLPHYRYVHVREASGNTKLADFGAARTGIPVRWSAVQATFADQQRITFRHVAGITRGMDVEWRLYPARDRVVVTIVHELRYALPLFGEPFARHVVGALFVHHIAGKTLRCFKEIVERAERADPAAG